MKLERSITRKRLDQQLVGLSERVGPPPPRGWVWTIRDALGMSTSEMASRMHVSPSRISQIERAELHGMIQLFTLWRAAGALDCRFVYFLAPKEPLEDMVWRQAFTKAAARVGYSVSDNQEPDNQEEDEALETGAKLDLAEGMASTLVDARGLWTVGRPNQPAASAGPASPDPLSAPRPGLP